MTYEEKRIEINRLRDAYRNHLNEVGPGESTNTSLLKQADELEKEIQQEDKDRDMIEICHIVKVHCKSSETCTTVEGVRWLADQVSSLREALIDLLIIANDNEGGNSKEFLAARIAYKQSRGK